MAGQETPVFKRSERRCTTKTDHSYSIMRAMNNQRKQGTLCDVILVVQGKHLPAHRGVLAAASHFFHLMFTAKMKESLSDEVELRGTEPEIMEMMFDFIYTRRISMNSSNVLALLHAANQYLVDPLKMMCEEFLKGQIDATNCLGIAALAETIFCPGLKAKAETYLQKHFSKVCEVDEFLQLDVARLKHLLHQDVVCAEEQIYDAALRWLRHDLSNRRQYLVEVLSCIRFPLISKTFLSKTVQAEPLIQDNPQCLSMLIGGMRYHLLNRRDRDDLGEISRPRFKKTTRQIALFKDSPPHSCCYFNPKDSSWTNIRCSLEMRQDAVAVYWDDVVYILGGSHPSAPVDHMDCYNIRQDRWCSKLGPLPRGNLAASVVQGKVYVSGGAVEGGPVLDLFECYDTETDLWEVKASMLVARCCHGSVEVNGLIYVCGGTAGDGVSEGILDSCEVFNPNTQKWRALEAMRQARKNHGLVVVRNKIYAVGGQGPQGRLRSVEYYDISTNVWCHVTSMPWFGLMLRCAAVGDVIYVLAGKGAARLRNVLEYHAGSDRWVVNFEVQAFPVTDCVICVVDT